MTARATVTFVPLFRRFWWKHLLDYARREYFQSWELPIVSNLLPRVRARARGPIKAHQFPREIKSSARADRRFKFPTVPSLNVNSFTPAMIQLKDLQGTCFKLQPLDMGPEASISILAYSSKASYARSASLLYTNVIVYIPCCLFTFLVIAKWHSMPRCRPCLTFQHFKDYIYILSLSPQLSNNINIDKSVKFSVKASLKLLFPFLGGGGGGGKNPIPPRNPHFGFLGSISSFAFLLDIFTVSF